MTELMNWVLGAASAFVLLSSAAEKGVRAWRAARTPQDRQDRRLEVLEGRLEKAEGCLSRDKQRLDGLELGDRATHRALLALLDHGIDGNNREQMKRAKEELQEHLINR